jgi:hypothetical protein
VSKDLILASKLESDVVSFLTSTSLISCSIIARSSERNENQNCASQNLFCRRLFWSMTISNHDQFDQLSPGVDERSTDEHSVRAIPGQPRCQPSILGRENELLVQNDLGLLQAKQSRCHLHQELAADFL